MSTWSNRPRPKGRGFVPGIVEDSEANATRYPTWQSAEKDDMTDEVRARLWLAENGPVIALADWASLARAFAAVRAEALEQAGEVCDREAAACAHHAKAFREMKTKDRMPVHRAHTMAAGQSSACAHYIRALKPAPVDG